MNDSDTKTGTDWWLKPSAYAVVTLIAVIKFIAIPTVIIWGTYEFMDWMGNPVRISGGVCVAAFGGVVCAGVFGKKTTKKIPVVMQVGGHKVEWWKTVILASIGIGLYMSVGVFMAKSCFLTLTSLIPIWMLHESIRDRDPYPGTDKWRKEWDSRYDFDEKTTKN